LKFKGVGVLANHKSALKRARQSESKKIRNMGYKTRTKNVIKEVRAAISDNSKEQAEEGIKRAASIIQKTASKGAIPKKRAARKISRLARQVNQITSS
jgi:small subunit ribosomal protein S20